jgi:DNA (cytosine-5)-methyltransferase 1
VRRRNKNNHNVIDLFCGVGGFSLGAARAGFKVSGSCDVDKRILAAHERNFPSTTHLNVDLSNMTGKSLLKLLGEEQNAITGIIGGPPCQGFSVMGHQRNNDVRNKLFVHFFRIVSEIKPLFFVCENVPGILDDDYKILRENGFDLVDNDYLLVDPMKFIASDYGAPTTRARIFFFGIRNDSGIKIKPSDFLHSNTVKKIVVKDALRGLPVKINPDWQEESQGWRAIKYEEDSFFGTRLSGLVPSQVGDKVAIRRLAKEKKVSGCLGTRHSKAILKRFREISHGEVDRVSKSHRLNPNGFCPTLRAGTGSERGSYQAVRPIHPTEDRVITPREAARLQGFPDWFQFDSTKWHSFRQIGNSVSPILAEQVLKVLFERLI